MKFSHQIGIPYNSFFAVGLWMQQYAFYFIRSTSESRPNSIEGKNVRPYVRPYVRPSTKSFFNLNEIWYIGRGR